MAKKGNAAAMGEQPRRAVVVGDLIRHEGELYEVMAVDRLDDGFLVVVQLPGQDETPLLILRLRGEFDARYHVP